jgi:hypothetical protein
MLRHSGQSLNGDRYIHPFSLLSPPRQPCHGGCECAIKKASSNVVYPTLTHSNYIELSLVMMVNLQAAGLWDVRDYRADQSAMAAILAGLTVKKMTHDAWEAFRKLRLGADQVKEANAEQLKCEFGEIAFKPNESVEDFLLCLSTPSRISFAFSVRRSVAKR